MDRPLCLSLRLIGETTAPLRRIARLPSPSCLSRLPSHRRGIGRGGLTTDPLRRIARLPSPSCIFGRAQGHRPYTYRSPLNWLSPFVPLNWLSLSCTPLVPFVASPLASPVSPLTEGGLGGAD